MLIDLPCCKSHIDTRHLVYSRIWDMCGSMSCRMSACDPAWPVDMPHFRMETRAILVWHRASAIHKEMTLCFPRDATEFQEAKRRLRLDMGTALNSACRWINVLNGH